MNECAKNAPIGKVICKQTAGERGGSKDCLQKKREESGRPCVPSTRTNYFEKGTWVRKKAPRRTDLSGKGEGKVKTPTGKIQGGGQGQGEKAKGKEVGIRREICERRIN